METDVDRLESIKALGGQLVSVRGQYFWAIFENGSASASDMVESTEPNLDMRTSDVTALGLVKDDVVDGLPTQWRIRKFVLSPDGAKTVVLLRS